MTLLRIEAMSTGYLGVPVVRNVSFSVDEGQIVALLGPNGAGKTSTLLAVSGLNPILAGDIVLFGHSVRGRSPHELARTGVAHVPEGRSAFLQLTVRENLRLGATRGRRGVERALGHFPALDAMMDRPAGLLSGGEQQMLALARALAAKPRLLMVDELSLGLAPVVVQRLLPILRQIAREDGTAVLLVEQHTQLALAVADRGAVLVRGELVVEADAASLRTNHRLLEHSYLGGGRR